MAGIGISSIEIRYQQFSILLSVLIHISATRILSKVFSPINPLLFFLRISLALVLRIELYFPAPPFNPIILPKTPRFSRGFFPGPRESTLSGTLFLYAISKFSKLSFAACVEQSVCRYINTQSMRCLSLCMLADSMPLRVEAVVINGGIIALERNRSESAVKRPSQYSVVWAVLIYKQERKGQRMLIGLAE